MGENFNRNRAATALVEAVYRGDKYAAKHWGVTVRSIQNWRVRLLDDAALVELFTHKRDEAEKNWAADAPLAIRAAVIFILRAAQEAEVTPEMVHATAGAMKLLADMVLTKQVLDARLAQSDRPQNGRHREVAAVSAPSLN